jgi:antitoxin component YwqK of YwqJK toxin-antitoxin module
MLGYPLAMHFSNPCREDGTVTERWRNGQPSSSWVCLGGKKNGPATFWYPDGGPKAEGQYADDLEDGDWTVYNPSGNPRHEHWSRGTQFHRDE